MSAPELGRMHRNGHGRCGGCRVVVDRIHGGRQHRRAKGWTYTGRQLLGWVCDVCSRWAQRVAADPPAAAPDDLGLSTIDNGDDPSVRGFGLQFDTLDLSEVLRTSRKAIRSCRRLERRVENRRRGLPSNFVDPATMSPSAYAIWKRDRGRS